MFRTPSLKMFAAGPVLAFALLALPGAAHADDASKRAKAEELLKLTKADVGAQAMLAGFPDRVKAVASRQVVVQAATTPEQKKLTGDYLDQMSNIARSGANWEAVHPKIVDLYVATFTEADLDGIIAFYKTPAGQDYITKTTGVSSKTIELLQAPINALSPQFEAATKTYQESMEKTSPGGAAPAAAKPPTLGPETPAAKPAPKK